MTDQRFSKSERLAAKKSIELLFKEPSGSFFAHPVKLTYTLSPLSEGVIAQILLSVPKRNFKKAHDRNRIKRQLREIYRKNKTIVHDCLTSNAQQACFLLGYVGKEHTPTDILEQKVVGLLNRFADALAKNNT